MCVILHYKLQYVPDGKRVSEGLEETVFGTTEVHT